MTADELVGASGAERGRPSIKQEKAAEILKEILANGAVPQKKIEGMLREHGISRSTAKIVKRRLGIESVKPAGQHNWYWKLPEEKKELDNNEEGNNPTGTQQLSG